MHIEVKKDIFINQDFSENKNICLKKISNTSRHYFLSSTFQKVYETNWQNKIRNRFFLLKLLNKDETQWTNPFLGYLLEFGL
jgi:hypothetical protein